MHRPEDKRFDEDAVGAALRSSALVVDQLDAAKARITGLEAALRAFHEWHLNLDEDVEGYLESKLFERASAAMPSLKTEQ